MWADTERLKYVLTAVPGRSNVNLEAFTTYHIQLKCAILSLFPKGLIFNTCYQ